MKTGIKIMIKASAAVSVMLLLNLQLFAQGTDSRKTSGGTTKQLYIGLSVDPISTKISNEGFSTNLKIEKGGAINITAEGCYFFSDLMGAGIGVGLSSYSSTLSIDSSSYKFMSSDSEDEEFEMRVKGRSIKEDQKISFLSIPVCLNLRYKASDKFGLYLKPGVSFNIPLSKKYNENGVFTYDAYYAQYPVLLQNLPDFGLASNYNTDVAGDLEIKSFSMTLTVAGGVTYSINDDMMALLGITMNKSVGNISDYQKNEEYMLTRGMDDLSSIMAGSTSSGLQSFGISIGFRYFLK